jgi:RNA polymerase sigma-70 factor (ECF subfamily)
MTPPRDESAEAEYRARLKAGEGRALKTFVEEHQGPIYRLCLRLLKSEVEAEDMAQETLIRALKGLSLFREESALSTWVYRIALNVCHNRQLYLRRRHTQRHVSVSDLDERGDSWQLPHASPETPETLTLAQESERLLSLALHSLEPDHRLLLSLRDGEQLSYQELVELTGWALGTVKSKLHRARQTLAARYEALARGEPLPLSDADTGGDELP